MGFTHQLITGGPHPVATKHLWGTINPPRGGYTQSRIGIPTLAGLKSLEDQRSKAHWGRELGHIVLDKANKIKQIMEVYHQLSSNIPMIAV